MRSIFILIVALASLAFSLPAGALQDQADELAALGFVRLDSVEGGALLFESDAPGWYVVAPTLHTDIDIAVSGPIARATVSQRFLNAADVFVEGKYVFPLPEGAAVDSLRMKVGDRWIEGMVEERAEAREIYEQALAAGQVASLIEQQRPNTFTTSIANIAPSAEVIVQIEYQQSLAPRDGAFGLRVPLVVAPRYTPGDQAQRELSLGSTGWLTASGRQPVVDPRTEEPGSVLNPVEISVDLDAGFPLGDVQSPYHDVDIERRFENAADVEVAGPIPADRDFYLSWRPSTLTEPYAAAFTEQRQGETHYVAMVTPPVADQIDDTRSPREVIFVQDTSGSMGGESMEQAKAGLIAALGRLTEQDTFNIIEFDSFHTTFASESVRATPESIEQAIRWVNRLVADEGTNMLPALEAALDDDDASDGRLRQVIFLTDGAVSNELQMLDLIERDLGDSRLFTVGIGAAPNSYFMTAAARSGRGSFVYIGNLSEVSDQMQTLFEKIESPAVVDLVVDGLPSGVEVSPSPIPDLYAGDPVSLTVRLPQGVDVDTLRLTGQRGDEDWHIDVVLADAELRPGVSKLWARERIRDLEALRVSPEVDEAQREQIDADVLGTALEFGLVSRLTSLVAVDVEVTRPESADSTSAQVPANLPDGWDADVFLGNQADQQEPAIQFSDALLDRLGNAQDDRAAAAADPSLALAATGADWQLRTLLGALLVAIGGAGFWATGRRESDGEQKRR